MERFADQTDNNTTYQACLGVTVEGTTFSLAESYTDARYWNLAGNGVAPGTTKGGQGRDECRDRCIRLPCMQ